MDSPRVITNLVLKVSDFIHDFTKLAEVRKKKHFVLLRLWYRLKTLYYIGFRYPSIMRDLNKALQKYSIKAATNPGIFLELLTEFMIILVSLKSNAEELQEFINKLYERNRILSPISITHVELDKGLIKRVKVKVEYLSQITDFNKGKIVTSTIDLDMKDFTCTIETDTYDVYKNDEGEICKKQYLTYKRFDILSNGTLYNPNYIYAPSLQVDELKAFSMNATFILSPFITLIFFICGIEFIYARQKREE